MNARQTRLFHRTYALTRSLSAAFRAACRNDGCAPRCCSQRGGVACRAVSARAADGPRPAEEADIERAVAALESEAVWRALSGVPVPVFHQGRECGSTIKHSDQLLMFLLKTLKPGRYAGGKDSEPTTPPAQDKIFALELDLAAAAHGQDEGEAEETDASEGGAAFEEENMAG